MPHRIRLLTLLLALSVLWPAAAPAQTSDAQLRKENERLREENHGLQLQIDELRQRLQALEAQMQELLQAFEALQAGQLEMEASQPDQADESTLPDDPLAAPDAMFAYLERAYDEAFADVPRDTAEESARYQRLVELWVGRMNLELRGEVTWIVKPLEASNAAGSDLRLTLEVLDPETLAPIGEAFRVLAPIRLVRRVGELEEGDHLKLTGALTAMLAYDEQRLERGMFNDPPFLAPYVVFGYDLNVRTLQRLDEPPADAPTDGE